MKILHSYCLNYNLGDYALGIGVKNLLRHYLDVTLIGNTNLQGRDFNEFYIKEVINKKYDLLVIGGGGIIHGSHWPNGWFWLIEKELIKEIKIPFIIYGVGYNYWKEEGGIPERGKNHLKEVLRYAKYFSIRNDGSQDRFFEQIGVRVPVVPDPGFHINLNSTFNRVENEPYVIIQLANDKPNYRFGSPEKRERFISQIRNVIKDLSLRYKVILAPHVVDDIELSYRVVFGISNCLVWDFGRFAFDHVEESIAYYKYANFVIAMRGHGQIIPIAFNTPVISLENHPKHKGLMDNLRLNSWNVNINDSNLSKALKTKIKELEANYFALKSIYNEINNKLINQSDTALKEINKIIGNINL